MMLRKDADVDLRAVVKRRLIGGCQRAQGPERCKAKVGDRRVGG
jgi:hypothetical protein